MTRYLYGRPISVGYDDSVGYERGIISALPYTLGGYHPHTNINVGALLPKTAVDVIQLENQYDPDFQATDAGWNSLWDKQPIGHVPLDLIDEMGAWKKFLITWNAMMTDPSQSGILGTADDQYQRVMTYIDQLAGWQTRLKARGGVIPGPGKIVVPPKDGGTNWAGVAWPVALGLGAVAAAMIFRK
jgi:hypothetical protein